MVTSTQKQFTQAFQPMTARNNQILQQWHENGLRAFVPKWLTFPIFCQNMKDKAEILNCIHKVFFVRKLHNVL